MCVRGASALGELLHDYPDADVQVIIVWEPVLRGDVGPPKAKVRAPLADPRVVEYWDPGLWMSKRITKGEDEIAWDFIAIYAPGTSWTDPFPTATWVDGPVVNALGEVENALRQNASRTVEQP